MKKLQITFVCFGNLILDIFQHPLSIVDWHSTKDNILDHHGYHCPYYRAFFNVKEINAASLSEEQ